MHLMAWEQFRSFQGQLESVGGEKKVCSGPLRLLPAWFLDRSQSKKKEKKQKQIIASVV